MKSKQRPKWSLVFSHLKSGVVSIDYVDQHGTRRDSKVTLVTGFIPDKMQKSQAPNNPLEQDKMTAFDLDIRQWVTFEIESIEGYGGIISYTYSGNQNVRERTNTVREASTDEGTQETGDVTKFRSRFDPEKG